MILSAGQLVRSARKEQQLRKSKSVSNFSVSNSSAGSNSSLRRKQMAEDCFVTLTDLLNCGSSRVYGTGFTELTDGKCDVTSSVSTGKPFCHSRESGNANSISREFPGSRELIFT
jgi:hypothetical protein